MRKNWIALAAVLLMALTFSSLIPVQAEAFLTPDTEKSVQLTEAQQKEIAALEKEILDKKKEVISKYVEYGVMSAEKGEKIIARLEKRYEKLEENGFIPRCDKSKTKHSD